MGFRSNPLHGYWVRMCAEPTKAEAAIEPAIAALGERYRHQYPFWGLRYFADFALLDRKLIIEVDGDSHDTPAQKEKDLKHTLDVLELGWNVVRISNELAIYGGVMALKLALQDADSIPHKEILVASLKAQLDQLHRDYPGLLAAAAKKATSRSQSAKAAAKGRRLARGKQRALFHAQSLARRQAKDLEASQGRQLEHPEATQTSRGKPKRVGRQASARA